MKFTSSIIYSVIVSLIIVQPIQAQKFLLELEEALNTPSKAVQCIHYYPEEIGNGKHHFVEVTAIKIDGNKIEIIETWEDWRGGKAQTVLRGAIQSDKIHGSWESNFSGGNWNYDLQTNEGQWNKTKSTFQAFDERFKTFRTMYPLEFKIVNQTELKDGSY